MKRKLALVFSALPLAAATLVLLLVPAGCNPIGCFRASEAGGTCPAEGEALQYFGDPDCGGRVASVDSGPTLRNGVGDEGTLCCYAITNKAPEDLDCGDF